jgi:hypothetical protein
MQSSGAPPGSKRYIVRAADGDDALLGFIDGIRDDPAVSLVDTIPSSGPPHTVVVETDEATVARLRQRHLNQLLFEPDRPLSLFD